MKKNSPNQSLTNLISRRIHHCFVQCRLAIVVGGIHLRAALHQQLAKLWRVARLGAFAEIMQRLQTQHEQKRVMTWHVHIDDSFSLTVLPSRFFT